MPTARLPYISLQYPVCWLFRKACGSASSNWKPVQMAEESVVAPLGPAFFLSPLQGLPSHWLEDLHLIGRDGQTWGVHIAVLRLRRTTYDMGEGSGTDCYQQLAGSSELSRQSIPVYNRITERNQFVEHFHMHLLTIYMLHRV